MKINSTQLLDAYEQTRIFLSDGQKTPERFEPIKIAFEDKKGKADAVIMVYGVYNAGKSTLINVLLGRDEAPTGDIPVTDKVTSYPWGMYSILDTPGVDAPIEHETVTKAQMLKADAVIFVVNPLGTVEEAKTLDVILDLVRKGKQVFLVLNEKNDLSEEDFIKIKDQTRARLQQRAAQDGASDVLKDIPIVKINAKRAFQGILKAQPKLVERSGYPAFERQLKAFLQSVSPDDIYGRLQIQLKGFLQEEVKLLSGRTQSGVVKKYDQLQRKVVTEKSQISSRLGRELARHRQNIYDKSKVALRTSLETCQAKITQITEQAGEQLNESLRHELQSVVSMVQDEIAELQAALPNIGHQTGSGHAPVLATAGGQRDQAMLTLNASGISSDMLKEAALEMGKLAKPEHVVSSLKVVKEVLPSLMKGIGIKTMEKWAGQLVGKWIPYAGLAFTAYQTLSGLFTGDPEEKRLREHHEEEQRQRERAVQQLEDFACDLADGFETSMRDIVTKETEEFFANISSHIGNLRQGFNDAEQANSQQLERLLTIQQQALSA